MTPVAKQFSIRKLEDRVAPCCCGHIIFTPPPITPPHCCVPHFCPPCEFGNFCHGWGMGGGCGGHFGLSWGHGCGFESFGRCCGSFPFAFAL